MANLANHENVVPLTTVVTPSPAVIDTYTGDFSSKERAETNLFASWVLSKTSLKSPPNLDTLHSHDVLRPQDHLARV